MADTSKHEPIPAAKEEEMLNITVESYDPDSDSNESPDKQAEAKEFPADHEAPSAPAPKDFITSLINDTSWADGLDDLWKH